MTTLTTQLTLAMIAQDLAPHLYNAECALLGVANDAAPYDVLAPAQKRLWLARAEVALLSNIGYVAAKAERLALRKAVIDNDIYNEFTGDALTLIEKTIDDAITDVPQQLQAVWRERTNQPVRR